MGTVIISTSDYINYANKHLLDSSTYKLLPDFPKQELLDNWEFLRQLLNRYGKLYKYPNNTVFLSDIARFILQLEPKPSDPNNQNTLIVGQFYMLMKVHKKELSGRPIISCTNTMTYYASKYLDKIVQPIMKQLNSYITSSQHLLYDLEIKQRIFPQNCWILCADIDSLYPNIPTTDGLIFFRSAVLRYNIDNQFFPSRDTDFICDLLHWVLNNNYFCLGDRYFLQINGTAMGTPVAVVYACLVLDEVEQRAFNKLTFRPLFYKRFIDDILSILQYREHCTELLDAICSILPSIKSSSFTISDTHGVFLDIELYKGTRFETTGIWDCKLYQKPQNKYLYLPPSSHHPSHVFKAWIVSEVNRYCLLHSDNNQFIQICSQFKQRLLDRGYKESFIEEQFSQHSSREVLLNKLDKYYSTTTHNQSEGSHSFPLLFFTKYNKIISDLKIRECFEVPDPIKQHPLLASIINQPPIICYSNYPKLRAKLCKARKTLHSNSLSNKYNKITF